MRRKTGYKSGPAFSRQFCRCEVSVPHLLSTSALHASPVPWARIRLLEVTAGLTWKKALRSLSLNPNLVVLLLGGFSKPLKRLTRWPYRGEDLFSMPAGLGRSSV